MRAPVLYYCPNRHQDYGHHTGLHIQDGPGSGSIRLVSWSNRCSRHYDTHRNTHTHTRAHRNTHIYIHAHARISEILYVLLCALLCTVSCCVHHSISSSSRSSDPICFVMKHIPAPSIIPLPSFHHLRPSHTVCFRLPLLQKEQPVSDLFSLFFTTCLCSVLFQLILQNNQSFFIIPSHPPCHVHTSSYRRLASVCFCTPQTAPTQSFSACSQPRLAHVPHTHARPMISQHPHSLSCVNSLSLSLSRSQNCPC